MHLRSQVRAVTPSTLETATAPTARSSRRLQGLPPEFVPSSSRLEITMATTTTNQASQTHDAQYSLPHVFHAPQTPRPFHGDTFEDVEDWLDHFERVASINEWDDLRKLRRVYFVLEDSAKTWYENHEGSFATWQEFSRQLRDAYRNAERKERAEQAISSRNQRPNERVSMFVEDMLRLFRRADPAMPEEKKVRHLMRGVKEQLFAGLVRNPPTTVAEFVSEATTMERTLQQRSSQYERHDITATACSLGSDSEKQVLADFIRSVVRDELRQLQAVAPVGPQPPMTALADVIRNEIRQAVQPLAPPRPEVPVLTYAAALRAPAPPSTDPIMRTVDQPTHLFPDTSSHPLPGSRYPSVHTYRPPVSRQSATKASVWRSSDNRPLCYHCGEAGHVYRDCQYRQLGLRGFHPDARCPRYGERPREIEAYLTGQRIPSTVQRRHSRSPSPRRSVSPSLPSSSYAPLRNRSPSPHRGN